MPSDDQMEGFLRDFFVAEAPAALKQPFRRPGVAQIMRPPVVCVSRPADVRTSLPRSRRMIVATAISVMAMLFVVAIQIKNDGPPQTGPVNGAGMATSNQTLPSAAPLQNLMLVSPNGDAKSAVHPVGEDGVTLEETDSIELKPQR